MRLWKHRDHELTCEVQIALSKSIKDRDTTIWAGTGLRVRGTIGASSNALKVTPTRADLSDRGRLLLEVDVSVWIPVGAVASAAAAD
jgi:hypothetical protein